MLYLYDKGNSLDLVEEATLYHHARLWATIHKDGSFDFHNGRTYLGEEPEDKQVFMNSYLTPGHVYKAVYERLDEIVPNARRIYQMNYLVDGQYKQAELDVNEVYDEKSAEMVSKQLLDTWSQNSEHDLRFESVSTRLKGEESHNQMFLVKKGQTFQLVEKVTWSKDNFLWADIYKDGSFDFYEDYEKVYTGNVVKGLHRPFMGSHNDGVDVLETLYERLDQIVPNPKPIYFMDYTNTNGKTKRVELTGKDVVDSASAEKAAKDLINRWSQNGKYDLKLESVYADIKGHNARPKNVAKMAGLEMSDLKDLGYEAVKEAYSKQ